MKVLTFAQMALPQEKWGGAPQTQFAAKAARPEETFAPKFGSNKTLRRPEENIAPQFGCSKTSPQLSFAQLTGKGLKVNYLA